MFVLFIIRVIPCLYSLLCVREQKRNAITSQTIELCTERGMGTKIVWKLKAFFLAHGTATHTSDLFSLPRVSSCACMQCANNIFKWMMPYTLYALPIGRMTTTYAFVFHMNFFAARSLKMNWINLFTFHKIEWRTAHAPWLCVCTVWCVC